MPKLDCFLTNSHRPTHQLATIRQPLFAKEINVYSPTGWEVVAGGCWVIPSETGNKVTSGCALIQAVAIATSSVCLIQGHCILFLREIQKDVRLLPRAHQGTFAYCT